ncbi:MAG: hypothetical protein AAFV47_09200 [Pseudomonadota bacterium]
MQAPHRLSAPLDALGQRRQKLAGELAERLVERDELRHVIRLDPGASHQIFTLDTRIQVLRMDLTELDQVISNVKHMSERELAELEGVYV